MIRPRIIRRYLPALSVDPHSPYCFHAQPFGHGTQSNLLDGDHTVRAMQPSGGRAHSQSLRHAAVPGTHATPPRPLSLSH